jgi:phosphate transport system permease protein
MFFPQAWREGRAAFFSWQPVSDVPKYSMVPLFVGTLKVTAVAMLVSVPIGIAAAIFTSEFAPRRLREVLKPTIELLAGIPSVVLGFFALIVMATVLQDTFGFTSRLNAVVAGLALALTVVPVIFTVSEDALTRCRAATARSLASARRAGRRRSTSFCRRGAGVLAAVVLEVRTRSIGETMIVLMATGNTPVTTFSFGDSVRTLPATIAAEMGEVVFGGAHYSVLFFIGVELFLFTFVLNTLAAAFVKRLVRRMAGTA